MIGKGNFEKVEKQVFNSISGLHVGEVVLSGILVKDKIHHLINQENGSTVILKGIFDKE